MAYTRLTPNDLTSNTSSALGVAFRNTAYNASFEAWKAFDGNLASVWTPSGSVTTGNVGFLFATAPALPVNRYRVARSTSGAYVPKSWVFEGSDDTTTGQDGTWTALHTVTNAAYGTGQLEDYDFVNTHSYKAYRFRVTASFGSRPDTRELEFGYNVPPFLTIGTPTVTATDTTISVSVPYEDLSVPHNHGLGTATIGGVACDVTDTGTAFEFERTGLTHATEYAWGYAADDPDGYGGAQTVGGTAETTAIASYVLAASHEVAAAFTCEILLDALADTDADATYDYRYRIAARSGGIAGDWSAWLTDAALSYDAGTLTLSFPPPTRGVKYDIEVRVSDPDGVVDER